MESPLISADVIDATEFPELADRYEVFGVPKTIISDVLAFEGALPEADVVAALLEAQEHL